MSEVPLIAIGIPVRDREEVLPRVLDSILGLDYPKHKIRFVFNENLSKDTTPEILSEFKDKYEDQYEDIRIINGEGVLGILRNQCMDEAKDTYATVFIDSDVIIKPDTMNRLLTLLEPPGVGMSMIAYTPPGWPRGPSERMFALSTPQGPHEVIEVGMGCTAIKMSILPKSGMFPPLHRNEDGAFSYKVRMAGFKIISDSSDPVEHLHTGYWNYFWFYWNYMGRARWELIKSTRSPRLILRMGYYTTFLASIPFCLISPLPLYSLTAITIIYHLTRFHSAYGLLVGPLFSIAAGLWSTICTWKAIFLDLLGLDEQKTEEQLAKELTREFAGSDEKE